MKNPKPISIPCQQAWDFCFSAITSDREGLQIFQRRASMMGAIARLAIFRG